MMDRLAQGAEKLFGFLGLKNFGDMDFGNPLAMQRMLMGFVNDFLGKIPFIGPMLKELIGGQMAPPEDVLERFNEVGTRLLKNEAAQNDPNAFRAEFQDMVGDWERSGKIAFDPGEKEAFMAEADNAIAKMFENGPPDLSSLRKEMAAELAEIAHLSGADLTDRLLGREMLHQERIEGEGISYGQAMKIGPEISNGLFNQNFLTYSVDENGNQEELGATSLDSLQEYFKGDVSIQQMMHEGALVGYFISDENGAGVYAGVGGPEGALNENQVTPAQRAQMQQPESDTDGSSQFENKLSVSPDFRGFTPAA